MSLKIDLLARMLDNEDIEERKSRFANKPAYYVGKREIAHFHSATEIDVRVTKPEVRRLLKEGDPRIHVRSRGGDWVEVIFKRASDIPFVLKLIELAVKANR